MGYITKYIVLVENTIETSENEFSIIKNYTYMYIIFDI